MPYISETEYKDNIESVVERDELIAALQSSLEEREQTITKAVELLKLAKPHINTFPEPADGGICTCIFCQVYDFLVDIERKNHLAQTAPLTGEAGK